MHLLVLSAFRLCTERLKTGFSSLNAPSGAQCFPTIARGWRIRDRSPGLNAPSGAQCFPTRRGRSPQRRACGRVSMHLLVLSAFRLGGAVRQTPDVLVSMHLLVLSAFRLRQDEDVYCSVAVLSQCTFWCSVLSDLLLWSVIKKRATIRLNAPSGAQCFPTSRTSSSNGYLKSQCTFWCSVLSDLKAVVESRLYNWESQCTFWCSVLSDGGHIMHHPPLTQHTSQCTFWCSVLSDSAPGKPRHTAVYRNEIAADLESAASNRPAPVQLNHTTAKNRHKPPQRRRHPLPTGTPPTFNEPKPKNRPLTTTPR